MACTTPKPRRRSSWANTVNTERLSMIPCTSRIGVPAAAGSATTRLRLTGGRLSVRQWPCGRTVSSASPIGYNARCAASQAPSSASPRSPAREVKVRAA